MQKKIDKLKREREKEQQQALEGDNNKEANKTETPSRYQSSEFSMASSFSTTTKKKTKKSIIITSRAEATPQPQKKKVGAGRTTPHSTIDKVLLSVPRQRASSLNEPYEGEDPNFSDEEDEDDGGEGGSDRSSEDEFEANESSERFHNALNNPALENINRQRSASMSPHNLRPVLDFEDVITGKIKPTKVNSKKRNQTPQKVKRPVLSEELFKPPETIKDSPENTKINQLSQVQGGMNLVPENISSKPVEQIVEEIIRVLTAVDIKHRKRKHKYIWKCTADINSEPVQLELEIMNVKNNNHGILVRRIQGSFPSYQVLYNRIKKELRL